MSATDATHKDVVEEVPGDKKPDSDSDDVPELSQGAAPGAPGSKPNRGEKKCRKAMQKLGLKPVPGITRVTMKRSKNMLFTVETPEVLKSPNADIYVVLGAAKFEDLSQIPANTDMDKIKAELPKKEEPKIETIKEEADEGDDEDESGLNAEDIKNIMEHTKCTKAKAIKALRETGGDTVEAILKLS